VRFSDINDPLIRFNDEFVAYCPGPNDPFGFRRLRGHVSYERIGRPLAYRGFNKLLRRRRIGGYDDGTVR